MQWYESRSDINYACVTQCHESCNGIGHALMWLVQCQGPHNERDHVMTRARHCLHSHSNTGDEMVFSWSYPLEMS